MLLATLKQIRGRADELQKLANLWDRIGQSSPRLRLKVHQTIAARLLSLGEPLLAYDVTQSARRHWRRNPKLPQKQALALSRSGDLEGARRVLEVLSGEGHKDEETLGIFGGVYKSLSDRDAGAASN